MTHHPYRESDTERQREELARRRQARLVMEAEDVKWLMGTERGRRTVWGLLDRAGLIFGDAMVDDGSFNTNAMTMARDAGRRSVVWRIDQLIRLHCPDLFIVMRQENMHDAANRNDH